LPDKTSGNDRFRLLFGGAAHASQGIGTTRTMIMQIQKVHPLSEAHMSDAGRAVGEGLTLMRKALLRISRILIAVAKERDRRRAIEELLRFDNHMLADVGIKRAEIEHVVRNGRRGL
jgi:uncharacterized protein YjiS (DUF1127 family)